MDHGDEVFQHLASTVLPIFDDVLLLSNIDGVIVVVMVWSLDLQLHVRTVCAFFSLNNKRPLSIDTALVVNRLILHYAK